MTDFWRGRRVLVTGGEGFVGGNLCLALERAGAQVWSYDFRRGSSLDVLHATPKRLFVDVSNYWLLRTNIFQDEPEIIFHLAGRSHISSCQSEPLTAWTANVQGTWNVLEACRILPTGQIRAVVAASSNHVFGSLPKAHVPRCALGHRAYPAVREDSLRTMWLEDDPCGQVDVYGTSKGMVDLLIRAYGHLTMPPFPVAALRHVNCFGPGDPHRSHLVTGTICDLLDGRPPIITSDGTPLKAYLDVSDICSAYLLLAERVAAGDPVHLRGSSVNAGGAPISVLALADMLIQVSGLDLVPEITGEDMSQSGYVEILDDSTLRGLDWSPAPLHAGLARTWDWYKERKGMAWLSP